MFVSGFVLPDGTYALSQSQVAEAIGKHHSSAARFLKSKPAKALLGEDFRLRTFEAEIERDTLSNRGANTVKIIPTRLATAFWMEQ